MTAAGIEIVTVATFLLFGAIAGMAFFLSLRRVVAGYLQGGRPWRTVVLQVFRLLMLGGLFWFAARYGAAALLSMLGGFLLARFAVARPAPSSP